MQRKKLLIIIGLLLIGIILFLNIMKSTKTTQPEGEYLTSEDAVILLRALDTDIQEPEAYETLSENASAEEYITYGLYQKIAKALMPDRKVLFADKYEDSHYMLKEDWYTFFDELIALYDTQELFHEETVTVLSADALLTDTSLHADHILVADEELYRYESSAFCRVLYQPLTAVMKGDILLTIRNVNASEYCLSNVWIVEIQEAQVRCFWRNAEFAIPLAGQPAQMREQIADISFSNGQPQSMRCKTEKVSGKLLSVSGGTFEIAGVGSIPAADNFKIYKLYGTMESYYTSNLRIGYDFTDYVVEEGKICACLVTRDEAMETIRVLIQNSDYQGRMHERITLSADSGYEIRYYDSAGNPVTEQKEAGEETYVDLSSQYVQYGRMYLVPKVLTGKITLPSIARSQGVPQYRGTMEIVKTAEGLVVINELLLEEYLYAVVPSEMPASYPLEALKSQAVCARTYAYRSMVKAGLPVYGAHVDDSTSYQVYNNTPENAETTRAVKETAGQLLYVQDALTGTYYYSTSCGYGTNAAIWKSGNEEDLSYLIPKRIGSTGETEEVNALSLQQEEVFAAFITKQDTADYENAEGWYRWTYTVEELEEALLLKRLQDRYAVNEKLICTLEGDEYVSRPIEKLGKIKDIRVEKRGEGGIIDELIIEGEKAVVKVITEHNVRYVLDNGTAEVIRQDGSRIAMPTLLPSAFFVIESFKKDHSVVGYNLIGGGFGHGVGMSQNAAKAMAAGGMTCGDILRFFYDGSEIKNIYEGNT